MNHPNRPSNALVAPPPDAAVGEEQNAVPGSTPGRVALSATVALLACGAASAVVASILPELAEIPMSVSEQVGAAAIALLFLVPASLLGATLVAALIAATAALRSRRFRFRPIVLTTWMALTVGAPVNAVAVLRMEGPAALIAAGIASIVLAWTWARVTGRWSGADHRVLWAAAWLATLFTATSTAVGVLHG